jgi:hypothetical protein
MTRAKKTSDPKTATELPNEAQAAPEAPKMAQKDAAAEFMKATAKSQAFAVATDGLLGAVRLGLPGADVYFRVKSIEEAIGPDGKTAYLNQAIVALYKLPDGARMSPTDPRLWLVADSLVPAFRARKAKVQDYQLRLAVDRQGTPYLIPVPIGGRDIWSTSLANCVRIAEGQWIKMYSDSKKGRLHEPGDDQTLEPTFPAEEFSEIYMLALMPVYIDTKEHEIYKRICGVT